MNSTEPSPNETRVRAVVFDLDGLIANTEDLYEKAGELVLGRRGKTYDEELREQIMGRPVVDSIRIMIDCHSLPDTVEALIQECGQVLQDMMASSLAPMPGVLGLVDDLDAAQTPMAVATSATPDYADDVLTRLGLTKRFRFVLTAADISHGKPDPEIYLLAAKKLGLPPAEIVVLEDSANGVRSGVDSGAITVAVPNRHTAKHSFAGARLVANTLDDNRLRRLLGLKAHAY